MKLITWITLRNTYRSILGAFLVCVFCCGAPANGQLVPESFDLNESADNALSATWLTDEELSQLRVFHGVWDERDLTTEKLRAMVALNAWDLENPALNDDSVPVEWRAQAQFLAGNFEKAIDILKGARSNFAARIRAESYEGLGQMNMADESVEAPVERLLQTRVSNPQELTEGVRAMMIRARIQGQPSRDYHTMMSLLARAHQELDRLYWPAILAEAELLLEKDNPKEGIEALYQALSFNPRCAQGWFRLGRVALDRFDFDSANVAADALRRLNPDHPLADLLEAEVRLIEDDPVGAMDILNPLLDRMPNLRQALALRVAAYALLYNENEMQAAFDEFDKMSPGSAQAYYVAGRHLSLNRQYEIAADVLDEAILRQPAWPTPQIELGLMELQSGRDHRALGILERVVQLDPFNKRAANSLHLLKELAEYKEIESPHFIVRYEPGIDEVLAGMMVDQLERIHETVVQRFEFEPDRKTIIEVHPNHARFAVRITGMPFVHTVAACTGPVIAMEVPREGSSKEHLGLFDWPRVIQHEYTHTITLAQTKNRIPHWLTEAAAVSMEFAPRSYNTCQLLAKAHREGTLFSLDDIKWAFVRPKKPTDRGQAYAQGHWMVEYMNERFGDSALIRLLNRYFQGEREEEAMPNALGISRDQFFADFLVWAEKQVESWGLATSPTVSELADELRWNDPELAESMAESVRARLEVVVEHMTKQIGRPSGARRRALTADKWPPLIRPPIEVTEEILAKWLEEYPEHPDLLELKIRRMLEQIGEKPDQEEELIALLWEYMHLRPVDPFPHKKLTDFWLKSDTPERALLHLEELDIREEKTPVYASKLAELYRQQKELDKAVTKITRAVHMNPYHAPNRELAASIAIEAGDLSLAQQHIKALTLLEPDRPQHSKRLDAINKMLDNRGG